MKKMISLALCLTLALAFTAGCKKKEEAPAPRATPLLLLPLLHPMLLSRSRCLRQRSAAPRCYHCTG